MSNATSRLSLCMFLPRLLFDWSSPCVMQYPLRQPHVSRGEDADVKHRICGKRAPVLSCFVSNQHASMKEWIWSILIWA
ncbi:hypothetical protein F4824DRAFT_483485 [Ustulina deusta]|nr:hypothetical protein F4824DRAFT_483485 [Ustulina deusta]